MVDWLRWLEPIFNQGEHYEKLPRLVVYFILPVACFLMLVRVIEATIGIYLGTHDSLIVSHEVEDQIDDLSATHHDQPLHKD